MKFKIVITILAVAAVILLAVIATAVISPATMPALTEYIELTVKAKQASVINCQDAAAVFIEARDMDRTDWKDETMAELKTDGGDDILESCKQWRNVDPAGYAEYMQNKFD